MITITYGHSYSHIGGLKTDQFAKLRKLLSYEADNSAAFYSGRQFSRTRYCIDVKGNYPSGLNTRVCKFLSDLGLKYETKRPVYTAPDTAYHISKPFHGFKPHQWQLDAAAFAKARGRSIICAPTGSGKSLVISLVIAQFKVRTLVVVPSLQIKEQLTDDLMERFSDMSNIRIENIDSKALKTLKDFDLLVIDESHHVAAKTYHKLNKNAWTGIANRVFLTATPFRNRTEETLLFEGIAGTAKYTLTYKDAVAKGYIVPVEAYFIEVPKQTTEAYTWQQVYSQLVVNNTARNEQITDLLLGLANANLPTLCLVKEIAHGKILSEMTGIPFANGQDEESRGWISYFNKGKLRSLIATEGVCGEGVNTQPCEYIIIAGAGKAKSSFMQKVGRAVRRYKDKESGKVILIRDASHRFLLKHFNEQKKILKDEYEVLVQKLEIK